MITQVGTVNYTIGRSIPFREDGKDLPLNDVYSLVHKLVSLKAEEYKDSLLSSIYLRIYLSDRKDSTHPIPSDEEISIKIREFQLQLLCYPAWQSSFSYIVSLT